MGKNTPNPEIPSMEKGKLSPVGSGKTSLPPLNLNYGLAMMPVGVTAPETISPSQERSVSVSPAEVARSIEQDFQGLDAGFAKLNIALGKMAEAVNSNNNEAALKIIADMFPTLTSSIDSLTGLKNDDAMQEFRETIRTVRTDMLKTLGTEQPAFTIPSIDAASSPGGLTSDQWKDYQELQGRLTTFATSLKTAYGNVNSGGFAGALSAMETTKNELEEIRQIIQEL